MMKTVYIETENNQLKEMGIEQEAKYAPFTFDPDMFVGYWISEIDNDITFYVGPHQFLCKYSAKNIKLFNDILNEKSCSCHNNLQQA